MNGSYTKIMNALDTKLANGKKLSHDLNVIFKTFKRENCAQQDKQCCYDVSFPPATTEIIDISMWAIVHSHLAKTLLTKSVKLNSSFN